MTDLHRVPPMLPGQFSIRQGGAVWISCPCCNAVSPLDWPYQISKAGTVTPRWLCVTCNWSGDLHLVDYGEEVVD